ncbi:MAG: hypothetical protein QOG69_728 [Actinomycetota bacterium]|jgi:hypothetical protein|nr:hypothetical protein [Actinomycetota bacterium]
MVVDVRATASGGQLVTVLYPNGFCEPTSGPCVATLDVATGQVGPLTPYTGAVGPCGATVWPTATTSAYNRDPTTYNECLPLASVPADLRPGAAGWLVWGYDGRNYLELASGVIVGHKPAPRPTQWPLPAVMPTPSAPASS